MSRNALKTIFTFSIVIELLSIYLFYITYPKEPTFIAIVIAYSASLLVSILSLISYKKTAIEEGFAVNLPLIIAILIGGEFVLILIRTIIILVP